MCTYITYDIKPNTTVGRHGYFESTGGMGLLYDLECGHKNLVLFSPVGKKNEVCEEKCCIS
jgi:hypothetical protein